MTGIYPGHIANSQNMLQGFSYPPAQKGNDFNGNQNKNGVPLRHQNIAKIMEQANPNFEVSLGKNSS